MVTKVFDDYYLGLTAIITVVYQLLFFSIAFTLQFDKLTGRSLNVPISILTLNVTSMPQ
jgi:hypothetical protein